MTSPFANKLYAILFFTLFALSANLWAVPQHVSASANVVNPPNLLVDDWNHSNDVNNLSGANADIADGSGLAHCSHVIVSTVGYSGGSLELKYDVNSGSWAGYNTKFSASSSRNMVGYRNLSFYVKGAVGGELFKIEIKTPGAVQQGTVYISDYLNGGVSTTWSKVTIPLDAFTKITDWAHLYEMNFIFDKGELTTNGSPLAGTVYIDNLMFGSDTQSALVIDGCHDKFGVDGLGGNMGDLGGSSHVFVSSQYVNGGPLSLEITYAVNSGNTYAGVFYIVDGGGTGWIATPHDISAYDRFTFYVKAADDATNPGVVTIEINNNSYSIVVDNITTSWQKKTILFTNPSLQSFNFSNFSQFNIIIKNENAVAKTGKVYFDNIQIENGGVQSDTTPPTAPTNLKYLDTASGHGADGTTMSWMNWLSVTAPSISQDSTMQDVRFQYSTNGGTTWHDIATDFDTADGTYYAWWDTSNLADNTLCLLQAISEDIYGNPPATATTYSVTVKHYPTMPVGDDAMLDIVEKQIFWYYMAETSPDKKYVKDRARNFVPDNHAYASVAATGAGLVAVCIGHYRGWISTTEAYNRAYRILQAYNNAYESSSASDQALVQYNGFFYHYTDFGGARTSSSELSTIDSTLFAACALTAGQYFKNLGLGYDNLWTMADQIYRRMDWDWMRNGQACISWGWMPVHNFNISNNYTAPFYMDTFCEDILSYIMAAASPSHPITNGAAGWNAMNRPNRTHRGIVYIFEKTLFTHQYPQLFLDLSKKHDAYGCYAANTWLATIDQHRYAYDKRGTYTVTYGTYSWGLGAIDVPTGAHGADTYYAYGIDDDAGLIALNNQHTAVSELPGQVAGAIRWQYANYKNDIWGKYGFADSYTRETTIPGTGSAPWRGPDTLGIQQGAVLMAIENYRSGMVKNNFMQVSYIQQGLNNLNFVADSTAPAAITDLAVCAVGSHDVTLSWTAPGNDNYTGNISSGIYEVRFTTTPAQAWDSMPWNYLNYDIIWSTSVTACQRQSRTITNLTPDSTFYFSIKLADDSFNWSPVSPSATMYIAP